MLGRSWRAGPLTPGGGGLSSGRHAGRRQRADAGPGAGRPGRRHRDVPALQLAPAEEPEKLIEQALKADPKNLKALALATIAFDNNGFAKAARLWEAAIASAEPGSELARNLEGGVAGRSRRPGPPPSQPPAANAVAAATGASVSGEVQHSRR